MENTLERLTSPIDGNYVERGIYAFVVSWIVAGYALALLALI